MAGVLIPLGHWQVLQEHIKKVSSRTLHEDPYKYTNIYPLNSIYLTVCTVVVFMY